jgi:hypothetical protein
VPEPFEDIEDLYLPYAEDLALIPSIEPVSDHDMDDLACTVTRASPNRNIGAQLELMDDEHDIQEAADVTTQSIGTEERTVIQPPIAPAETLQGCTSYWFWRILLLLSAWLHFHFHVPHRACTLLLKILKLIFIALGHIPSKDDNEAPVTLTTTFKRLHLDDTFNIHPTCPSCHRLYSPELAKPPKPKPSDEPKSSPVCDHCKIPLFKFWDPKGAAKNIPYLRCPTRPVSEQLSRLLNRPGVEEACDAWRSQETRPGYKSTIMDGNIWKTLPGADKKPFFDNDPNRESANELRLGILLGFDG